LRDTKKRSSVLSGAVLADDFHSVQEGFACQVLTILPADIGNAIQDDDQRVGDEEIGGIVADRHIVPVFARKIITATQGDECGGFAAQIDQFGCSGEQGSEGLGQ